MTDRPSEAAGDPTYPGQPPSYPGGPSGGPGQAPGNYPPGSYPGQSGYPGQTPGSYPPGSYPGQQPPSYGGGYGMGPAYPGGSYDGAAPAPGWSGLAIAALLCSLIPFLGLLAAVPLAIIALVKIRETRQRGTFLAIVAIVISVLWWVGAIGLGAAWYSDSADRNDEGVISNEGRLELGQIQTGDCLDVPGLSDDLEIEVSTYEMRGVPCDGDHNAEAVGIVEIEGDIFPGSAALDAESATQCVARLAEYAPSGLPAGVVGFRLVPTEQVWDDEVGHRSVCFAVNSDYSDMERSVTDK